MAGPVAAHPEALIRARFCQEWLALIEKEDEPFRSRFLARVTPEMRDQIAAPARVGWLPLALHVRLAEIQLETFGGQRAHEYYRRAFAASLKGPLLGPLMMTAARLLGLSPLSFVRWAPRGYEAGFRNAGEVNGVVLGPHRARLEYSNLPAIAIGSEAWVTSTQSSAYGAYDVLGVEGVIRLDERGRADGKLALDLEWGGDEGDGKGAK